MISFRRSSCQPSTTAFIIAPCTGERERDVISWPCVCLFHRQHPERAASPFNLLCLSCPACPCTSRCLFVRTVCLPVTWKSRGCATVCVCVSVRISVHNSPHQTSRDRVGERGCTNVLLHPAHLSLILSSCHLPVSRLRFGFGCENCAR